MESLLGECVKVKYSLRSDPIKSVLGHIDEIFNTELNINVNDKDTYGQTPLHKEVLQDHKDCVEFLINVDADIDAKDNENRTPLLTSILNDRMECAKILIKNRANVNIVNKQGNSPLHIAMTFKDAKYAELLIKFGAFVDVVNNKGETPLHWAAECSNLSSMKLLVKSDADIEYRDKYGQTPLHKAAYKGCLDCMDFLVQSGVNINSEDKDGQTPLHLASYNGHKKCAKFLIKFGAKLNVENKDGHTALHLASYNGHTNCVSLLIKSGANVYTTDNKGQTPLHAAINTTNTGCIYLLQSIIDINARNIHGQTALHLAAKKGNIKNVRELVTYGANRRHGVDDNNGNSPLHLAAYEGHIECVECLLEANGSYINSKNDDNLTPLQLATRGGHIECAVLLAKEEQKWKSFNNSKYRNYYCLANINSESEAKRKKLLMYTVENANTRAGLDILQLVLLQEKMDIDAEDKYTALNLAVINGNYEAVKLLIVNGADINKTSYTMTPLMYAVKYYKDNKIVNCLLENKADTSIKNSLGENALMMALNASIKNNLLIETLCRATDMSNCGMEIAEIAIKTANKLSLSLIPQSIVNEYTSSGHTLLTFVVENNAEYACDMIKVLVSIGADIDKPDQHNETPLNCAIRSTYKDIVEAILECKADPNLPNVDDTGKTPLINTTFIDKNATDIMDILAKFGADQDKRDDNGWSVQAYLINK